MHLTLDQHRVHDDAAVVNRDEPLEVHGSSVEIDLDHRDVRAEREGRLRRAELVLDPQRSAGLARHVGPGARDRGRTRDVEPRLRTIEHDVIDIGLEQLCGMRLRVFDETPRGQHDGRAARLQRARSAGAVTPRHECRVTVNDLDVGERYAAFVAGEHRKRRVQPLPVRRTAGTHEHSPDVIDLDAAVLPRAQRVRDLDVARHADAEYTSLPRAEPTRLLGSECGEVGRGQGFVHRPLVLAGVVAHTHPVGVWERLGRDEVAPPHIGSRTSDFGSEQFHHALDGGRRFGPTRASERTGGRRVREWRQRLVVDLGDVVATRGQHASHARGGPDSRERACVAHDHQRERDQLAVARPAELAILHLRPAVVEAHEVLGARLDEAHRSTNAARQKREQQLLGCARMLRAERPADVGHDHAHSLRVEAVHLTQQFLGRMGALT
ncbi:unannotated protein [freshwater metagenome]|uniref:Unannotated protein n=1 Tax=freshwater metagenome TaxID=449393 RepID=A0A6J7QH54_9ZZZZ